MQDLWTLSLQQLPQRQVIVSCATENPSVPSYCFRKTMLTILAEIIISCVARWLTLALPLEQTSHNRLKSLA
ncbi:uncharacterized protein N7458_007302 [Penicillium daleae]|uniref:Uncharacterized protein n=1 Tax=Penicillium daleae TaxID=63821 RepID=A0AAD6C0U6_9EURO|nr:uncharacterized protein N7458_007302 [Penicillium daleae]KAJ5443430.1 hypothetical protein N7458_007302 [Penicillium daleae]